MSQQIGGALGIAALSAIATSRTGDSIASGATQAVGLTDGFQAAFMGAAAIALVGVLVALFVVRRADLAPVPETVEDTPALEAAQEPTLREPRRRRRLPETATTPRPLSAPGRRARSAPSPRRTR
jgi:hypothetical protein